MPCTLSGAPPWSAKETLARGRVEAQYTYGYNGTMEELLNEVACQMARKLFDADLLDSMSPLVRKWAENHRRHDAKEGRFWCEEDKKSAKKKKKKMNTRGVAVSKLDWIMSLDYDEVEALRAKLGLENCQYETPGNPDRLCGNPSYTMSSNYGYSIPVCKEHEHA